MPAPLEVFCCYAREDQEMLMQLKKHLTPLERQGQIVVWSDTNLNAGVEWEKALHQHLESADIILLLISPDFMVSDYCYSTEMGQALTRHMPSKRELRTLIGHAGNLEDMAMSPDGTLLASGNNDRTITLWEVSTGQGPRTLSDHTGDVWGIAFNPDGTLLASASKDKTIKLWEVSTGQELSTLTDHTRDVGSVVFSPDGTFLASGSNDKTIKLWGMKP